MSQIQSALLTLFNKHRIVFWYDAKRELHGEYLSLILPGIELIELSNNEFAVKHRILRELPNQKFLIYHEGPAPADLDNWLLDVQLAQGEFRADQAALWLTEVGLDPSHLYLVQTYIEFFNVENRRIGLKSILNVEDGEEIILLKMLAVCTGSEPRLDEILENLLAELAEGKSEKKNLIIRCGLDANLWQKLKRTYGYQSNSPSIKDFAIELFQSCYSLGLGRDARFGNDALVFLKRWKDSIIHHQTFETLSEEFAEALNIKGDLQHQDYRKLAEMDLFRLIDQKILSELVRNVSERTISAMDCNAILRQRRRGHWYAEYQHLYEAIETAALFIKELDEANLSMDSLTEGVQRYAQTWHHLDQLYRKVIFHVRKSGHSPLLEKLVDLVENLYTNNYLLKLNNNFQKTVDSCQTWGTGPTPLQSQFFEKFVVGNFIGKNKKVYVIISDALRYEVGDELLSRIRREDRYEAELSPMLAMLPSFTQLGMAALLPNAEISFDETGSGAVIVDGINSQGTANRDKILKQTVNQSLAIRAEDLLSKSRDELRELVRDHEVIYIYHNRIDAVGDKKESEERVFEAVEETLEDILTIIKKLAAANATNILVTTDHGFIYQNRAIGESDFLAAEISGTEILYRHRRFVLGRGLTPNQGAKHFTGGEVGLAGNMEIQIPKSINRLRLQGSGSRFVHGGAALQEVVIPVIQINKKRESDVTQVSVKILRGASTLITSGQFSVSFYQVEPVTDKVQMRKLRAGIYTQAGNLLSDTHDLVFDLESDNPREREISIRFLLTREADQANNQEVLLKLEEQIENTTHFRVYDSARFTIRRSFTSDFD